MLPQEVMQRAHDEFLDWQHSGTSVREISHRGNAFMKVAAEAEADLRQLLAIPSNYQVLFMQGGATAQFSLLPLNLTEAESVVDFIDTGHWSRKAMDETSRYCRVHVAADAGAPYARVPSQHELRFSTAPAYVHYTPNETIGGVEFGYIPATSGVALVADMSSTILSRPLDVGKFGVIYAGAQKNIGPAGLTLVIVRDDLLGRARPATPRVFDYQAIAANGSMLNTPPTFAWYIAGLVFKWLRGLGGLAVMGERNRVKAARLYAAIDASGFYSNAVAKDARSWMNVTFTLHDSALEPLFLAAAAEAGLHGLKGHRAVGGMRASLYNAMPLAGVERLIAFLHDFEQRHG